MTTQTIDRPRGWDRLKKDTPYIILFGHALPLAALFEDYEGDAIANAAHRGEVLGHIVLRKGSEESGKEEGEAL